MYVKIELLPAAINIKVLRYLILHFVTKAVIMISYSTKYSYEMSVPNNALGLSAI
jgi:hypothetical protein